MEEILKLQLNKLRRGRGPLKVPQMLTLFRHVGGARFEGTCFTHFLQMK